MQWPLTNEKAKNHRQFGNRLTISCLMLASHSYFDTHWDIGKFYEVWAEQQNCIESDLKNENLLMLAKTRFFQTTSSCYKIEQHRAFSVW
jgi:hypothetical protein